MSGDKVLDSWALMAYLEGEERGRKVTELFSSAAGKGSGLFLSAVNWGEVLYVIESRYGDSKRDEIERLLDQMHVEVVPVDREIARQAAHFKATSKIPYADSFAAALAFVRKADLVTGDDDFRCVEKKVKITWL